MSEQKHVTIYTDGSCVGNPGPGGYAVVMLHGQHRKELSGGYRLTTNNRMELLAVIKALEALKYPCQVTVYSDATYVIDGIMKGLARRWRAQGWGAVKNPDLWHRLLDLCDKHNVTLHWVPGHTGVKENDACDRIAQQAATGDDLAVDEGYEQPEMASTGPTLFDGLE